MTGSYPTTDEDFMALAIGELVRAFEVQNSISRNERGL